MTEKKPESARSLVRRPLLAAALLASAVVPGPALAAYDTFLKFDGIDGESTVKGHDKWIQVYSTSVGFANASNQGNGRETGKPSCLPLSITKSVDKASPLLVAATMTGKRFATGTVEFVRSSGDGAANAFLKYELSNVILSSLGESGAAGNSTVSESLDMSYAKMTITYTQQNADGKPGASVTSSVTCSNNN